ncbi:MULTISPECIES: hypothetical protein [unclassified Wolbachia]|uniref:hypothetical protein n=1 Tax=unclassified Wolbachia TaxID=2640676 RepID=UPI003872DF77
MKDKPVREKKNLDKGLKRSVGKPACCVSKGGSSSNTASLPDLIKLRILSIKGMMLMPGTIEAILLYI